MSQIDYILKFADKATAVADAVAVLQTYTDAQSVKQFAQDHCLELTVWRNSQDTTDGSGNAVHHPLAGYFVLISMPGVIPAVLNHSAVQIVVDRDKMNAGQGGFLLANNIAGAILQDIRFSPVFTGMNVPWGGLN